MEQQIKLGDKVKDKHSGWEGIVTVYLDLLNGSHRYVVSGMDSDKQPADHTFDEPQLELVEYDDEDITPTPKGNVKNGDKVHDIASGWEGIVTGFYYYLNGCIRIEVSGQDYRTGLPKILVIDELLIERIGKKKDTIAAPKVKRTGGSRDSSPIGR